MRIRPASLFRFGPIFCPPRSWKLFPPITLVVSEPYVHGPEVVTSFWYSFKQTRMEVSHSSGPQPSSSEPGSGSQQSPLRSRPPGFSTETSCSSKNPEAWDTWGREGQETCQQDINRTTGPTELFKFKCFSASCSCLEFVLRKFQKRLVCSDQRSNVLQLQTPN